MFSAALYARVRTLLCTLHTRPRVQRASGIPCALFFERSRNNLQASGGSRRENNMVCPLMLNRVESGPSADWLPFLDTYRTMCRAPEPAFRRILEDVRELRFAGRSEPIPASLHEEHLRVHATKAADHSDQQYIV